MNIPLVDLKRQYACIKEEVDREIHGVLEHGSFVLGTYGSRFEADFAAFCAAEIAVGVNSGTAALAFSLMALEVGPGDEVILPANTFLATAEAVSHVGARPVLVDVDPETYNLDASRVEQAITRETRAVIPVHLYGLPADMGPLLRIAKRRNLRVVEDACQAHGAEYDGRRVGALGDMAGFSFYPGKNLGAYGDAGAVVTNERRMAEKIKLLRNHGSQKKYYHEVVGYNSRLDEIQAAVLTVKLQYLEKWTAQRRANAEIYGELLQDLVHEGLVIIPKEGERAKHVYHLYVIQVGEGARDGLIEHLNSRGIGAQVHYPLPIHLQKAYAHLGYKEGEFPVTERLAMRIVSLPMFPELERDEIEYVVAEVRSFLRQESRLKHGVQAVGA